ncbi:hypothetical protein EDD21DRAFT_370779 [Dissophora ornata]|nr:hypothetical protein BGZ58_008097 [Dissophora ornata]KAI8602822.1 hypothetical protein EDD21DRAFT_370779 [Dissophora ornata]
MAFNQKRASTTSSSFAANVSPRRQSSYGQIMAGTGGLPSTHTAALKAAAAAFSTANSSHQNSSAGSGAKRLNGLDHLSSFQYSQHRNQSLKARVARMCPLLVLGSPRRRRSMWIMLCTGGVVIMIFFLSSWEVKVPTPSVLDQSSPLSRQLQQWSSSNNNEVVAPKEPIIYRNPDGSEMDQRSIFMIRDFGAPLCETSFAGNKDQQHLPEEVKQERERARLTGDWESITRANAWTLSLAWKKSLKKILPNWKDYSPGWVGQGVVLGAFPDGDGKDTTANMLVQIKLIRSISSIPIEVWFERVDDVSEELHESIYSWGAVVRSLDEDASMVSKAIVHPSDDDIVVGSSVTPISSSEIQEFKSRAGRNLGHLQKAMTVAALINSGFDDIIYFSPSTLPMQSPRVVFQQPDYIRTGTVFWQHPSSFPAHDSPIWPIAQVDCHSDSYEQSWSAFALKHKDSWKGLFLAWYWLTGPEHATYENIFGQQSNDLLRLAWMAVKRPYKVIDRMPQAGLLDLSRSKGDGIGCNLGSTLYPTPDADVLGDPKKYAQEQSRQQKLFKQSHRHGGHEDFFIENTNVMMMDTSMDASLTHAGSNDHQIHKALEGALRRTRDPTRMVLTDAYAAGSEGRVCLKLTRVLKGHQHE